FSSRRRHTRFSRDWSSDVCSSDLKGVIGIVASRLTETYYKPTLVFTDGNNGEMVASARSVADFDVHDALENCSEFFLKFGGHPRSEERRVGKAPRSRPPPRPPPTT